MRHRNQSLYFKEKGHKRAKVQELDENVCVYFKCTSNHYTQMGNCKITNKLVPVGYLFTKAFCIQLKNNPSFILWEFFRCNYLFFLILFSLRKIIISFLVVNFSFLFRGHWEKKKWRTWHRAAASFQQRAHTRDCGAQLRGRNTSGRPRRRRGHPSPDCAFLGSFNAIFRVSLFGKVWFLSQVSLLSVWVWASESLIFQDVMLIMMIVFSCRIYQDGWVWSFSNISKIILHGCPFWPLRSDLHVY